ncbi:hypothetical protein [Mycobacterium kyorinense]|uniref:hypothetical protein n=1 Tax=Mycobacterium kyorinense TaxID=487514 RepID=UPI000A8DAA49|nr:hypothetical protein [Mycobacterium kyorinense]
MVIVLLLLAAVVAGANWLSTQSRRYPRNDASHPYAGRTSANDKNFGDITTPVRAPLWPWVLGMAVIAALVLGRAVRGAVWSLTRFVSAAQQESAGVRFRPVRLLSVRVRRIDPVLANREQ